MITEVILPKLGQTMEEGTLVEWFKEEGDRVNRGDLLFTVESDKATLDVEATARGFLRKVLVPAGETVPVLTVVALVTREADEDISEYAATGRQNATEGEQEDAGPGLVNATTEPRPSDSETGRIFASPRARKTAREQGVELALVTGTGPNGRIVEKDVVRYTVSQPTATAAPKAAQMAKATPMAVKTAAATGVDPAEVTGTGVSGRIMRADVQAAVPVSPPHRAGAPAGARQPMAGLRGIIAQRMSASHAETAAVTLVTEADSTELVKVRDGLKATVSEEWGFSPGYNDLLGLIVARALGEFPYMNARLSGDGTEIERLPTINLGIAVDTERGLLVPVISEAGSKSLRALGTEFRTLMERARAGKSLPDDLAGGTFTITNLGMYDIDAFTPIINLPEAAILGAGRIQPKPVVHDGEIVVRQMWTLSLVFDHRLVDGAPAASFLQRIKQLIENPYLLLG